MADDEDRVLVIGGGAAAHACVRAYRDAGGARPVMVVSADDRAPYFRPHVSKDYLTGDVGAAEMMLDDTDWYRVNGVEVVIGCEVTAVDVGARLATTNATDPLHWSRCVLATGSAARELPSVRSDDPAVFTLRH